MRHVVAAAPRPERRACERRVRGSGASGGGYARAPHPLVESDAWLHGANLIHANLIRANLINANLIRAEVSGANFSDADLRGATMPDGSINP